MPEDLKQHACWGRLWFEHPNGSGGQRGRSKKLAQDIIAGRKQAGEFMVLCQLHQIWNVDHSYIPTTYLSDEGKEVAGGQCGNDPAPECKGVIAVRERREPEGRLTPSLTSTAK